MNEFTKSIPSAALAKKHVLVHDYVGHPFTVEFSRALAAKGVRVTYVFFSAEGGPKGRIERVADDPSNFEIFSVDIGTTYSKSNLFKRRSADILYGKKVAAIVRKIAPDIVLSVAPTDAQDDILKAARDVGASSVFWCQDIYSIAITRILSRKLPGVGHLIGAWYRFLERRQMQRADHVVHITDGFLKVTDAWGIARSKISVIPNWGVIDKIPVLPRDTAWAREFGLTRARRVVYSGTMALKHNPDFLKRLAEKSQDDVDVVVVGFGVGAERLALRAETLDNLQVLPLQPFARFPEVLGSADVLVAVIEADAGEFSVPSKVLSYLCAGRPIVLAAPADNLAAQIVTQAGAGIVVAPDDLDGFVAAVSGLLEDPDKCAAMGAAGRATAEQRFDLDRVCTVFEELFDRLRPLPADGDPAALPSGQALPRQPPHHPANRTGG